MGGAVTVGLTVIAGAGSWLAAQSATGGKPSPRDLATLGALGVSTFMATMAATMLGTSLAQAVTLHVLPKAAGVLLLALAAEIAGARLPRVKGMPAPLAILAAGAVLEVLAQWTA